MLIILVTKSHKWIVPLSVMYPHLLTAGRLDISCWSFRNVIMPSQDPQGWETFQTASDSVGKQFETSRFNGSTDWFQGKSTGNHRFFPLNMEFSCNFSRLNQSIEVMCFMALFYPKKWLIHVPNSPLWDLDWQTPSGFPRDFIRAPGDVDVG